MFVDKTLALKDQQHILGAFSLSATKAEEVIEKIAGPEPQMVQPVKTSAVVTEQDQILVAEVQRQMQNCYLFWAARHPGLPRVPAIQAIGRCFLLGSRRYGDKDKYSLDQTSVMTMGMIERKELEKFIPKHN